MQNSRAAAARRALFASVSALFAGRLLEKELLAADRREVLVCAGTGCIAGGSLKIYDYLKSECEKRGLKTRVALRHEGGDDAIHFKKSGCHGFCEMGPLLQIEPEGFLYTHVKLEDCEARCRRNMISDCRAHCDSVLSTLGNTCINVTGELRRAENSISSLPAAFNALRAGLEKLEDDK